MTTAEHPDALSRRIEQLAAASADEQETGSLVALVGALRDEITVVRGELGSLRAETRAVRSDLDGLAGRLTGTISSGRSETVTLAHRVTELVRRLDGLGAQVDEVRTALPGLSRDLREGVEQVPVRTGARLDALGAELSDRLGRQVDAVAGELRRTTAAALERETRAAGEQGAALEDARGALESRLAVLEDVLDSLAERIEALARDGASTTTGLLQNLGDAVRGLDRRVQQQPAESADLLVGHVREVAGAQAKALEESLLGRLSELLGERDDALRSQVRLALAASAEQAARDRAEARALATTVRNALEGFAALVQRSSGAVERAVEAVAHEGQERTDARVRELDEHVTTELSRVRDELLARDESAAARLSAVQDALDAALAQVRTDVAAGLAAVRGEVGTLTPRLDELGAAGGATSAGVQDLRRDLLAGLADLRQGLQSVTSDSTGAVRAAVDETSAAVTDSTRALREDVLRAVEAQAANVVERLAALASDVTAGAAAGSAASDRLAVLASVTDDTRAGLDDLRATVLAATDELASELRSRAEEQAGEAATRLSELDARVCAQVGGLGGDVVQRLAELQGALTGRLGEVVGGVEDAAATTREVSERVSALAELGDRQRAELEHLLHVVHEDVVTATRALREDLLARTTEQLAALGGRMAALDDAVAQDAAATERLTSELTGVTDTTGRLEQVVRAFRDEWPTRTHEVVEGARAVAQGFVLDVREEVAARLDEVRRTLEQAVDGVEVARGGLDDGTDRLARAGGVLVAYLEQRDRLLEAERDRVLDDVLGAFAAGLSDRERSALAARVSDVVARRRDARDAERYRAAVGRPVSPTADLPDEVRDLAPLDAARARAHGGSAPADEDPTAGDAHSAAGAPARSRRTAARPVSALGRPTSVRALPGGGVVVPGPGSRAAGAAGGPATLTPGAGSGPGTSSASTARARARAGATGGGAAPSRRTPSAGSPGGRGPSTPRPSAARPAPGDQASPPAGSGASAPGPAAPPRAARAADRRGRLEVMPEVPSVDVALRAAAPQAPDRQDTGADGAAGAGGDDVLAAPAVPGAPDEATRTAGAAAAPGGGAGALADGGEGQAGHRRAAAAAQETGSHAEGEAGDAPASTPPAPGDSSEPAGSEAASPRD